MSERRTYSRTARKQLSREDRSRLIADMLGNEEVVVAPVKESPAEAPQSVPSTPKIEESFDALDALDAEFDEELSEHRAEEVSERHREEVLEHNALVETAIKKISDEGNSEPEQVCEAEEVTAIAPLALGPELVVQTETNEPKTPHEPATPARQEAELPAPLPLSAADLATQRKLREAYEDSQKAPLAEPADLWNKLAVMPVNVPHLEENLVITASRNEPAHGAFDVLRTRLVHTMLEHGWKRVAITSPSRNCGKTFTAVNLAISLSRYEANRTILLDMDMRNPSVAGVIGDPSPGCMGDFLRGIVPAEDFLVKFDRNNLNIGSSLAIGTNGVIEPYAAELAQDPATGLNLDRMMEEMSPDIVLFDMPPALAFDDVIAFRKQFDGVLMVVGGGSTSPEEVREVMRRLGEDTPLLGVVLNQAEGEDGSDYSYGY